MTKLCQTIRLIAIRSPKGERIWIDPSATRTRIYASIQQYSNGRDARWQKNIHRHQKVWTRTMMQGIWPLFTMLRSITFMDLRRRMYTDSSRNWWANAWRRLEWDGNLLQILWTFLECSHCQVPMEIVHCERFWMDCRQRMPQNSPLDLKDTKAFESSHPKALEVSNHQSNKSFLV